MVLDSTPRISRYGSLRVPLVTGTWPVRARRCQQLLHVHLKSRAGFMLISPSHLRAAARLVSTFNSPSRYARRHSGAIAVLLAASGLGCGDDDPVTPLPTPSTLQMIAGNDQVGRVSQDLPDPLVVRVLDQSGDPGARSILPLLYARGQPSSDPLHGHVLHLHDRTPPFP